MSNAAKESHSDYDIKLHTQTKLAIVEIMRGYLDVPGIAYIGPQVCDDFVWERVAPQLRVGIPNCGYLFIYDTCTGFSQIHLVTSGVVAVTAVIVPDGDKLRCTGVFIRGYSRQKSIYIHIMKEGWDSNGRFSSRVMPGVTRGYTRFPPVCVCSVGPTSHRQSCVA